MVDLVLLSFDIPLLYYYINLRSSINLSSGYIYLSLGIYLLCSFVIVSKFFCSELLETFVILSAILLTIKSPVTSATFSIILFEVVLSASASDYLA